MGVILSLIAVFTASPIIGIILIVMTCWNIYIEAQG